MRSIRTLAALLMMLALVLPVAPAAATITAVSSGHAFVADATDLGQPFNESPAPVGLREGTVIQTRADRFNAAQEYDSLPINNLNTPVVIDPGATAAFRAGDNYIVYVANAGARSIVSEVRFYASDPQIESFATNAVTTTATNTSTYGFTPAPVNTAASSLPEDSVSATPTNTDLIRAVPAADTTAVLAVLPASSPTSSAPSQGIAAMFGENNTVMTTTAGAISAEPASMATFPGSTSTATVVGHNSQLTRAVTSISGLVSITEEHAADYEQMTRAVVSSING